MKRPTRKQMLETGDSICEYMVKNLPPELWTRERYLQIDRMGIISEVEVQEENELPDFWRQSTRCLLGPSDIGPVDGVGHDLLEGLMHDTNCIVRDRVCCVECGIAVENILNEHCDCCTAILASIQAQPGLVAASEAWVAENKRRAKRKREMLGGKETV